MFTKNNRGFTLIELMIVIAIIAILMAYALPAYRDYSVRTKLSEGTAMAAAFKVAISEAFVENGTLSGLNNGVNGIPQSSALGSCVNNIAVANGIITITYNCTAGSEGKPDPNVDTAQLVWTPGTTSGNTLTWQCSATTSNPDQDPC